MIKGLSEDFDTIAEAKRQGKQFIKVLLHPRQTERISERHFITGCVELKGYKTGVGHNARFSFQEITGGTAKFEFDVSEREWICWLYDDNLQGPYSPFGFNRDFLAGHFKQEMFIIKDPQVYADVKQRAIYLEKNRDKIKAELKERKVNLGKKTGNVIEDIDAQMEALQRRKDQIEKFNAIKNEDQVLNEEIFQKITTDEEKNGGKINYRGRPPKLNLQKDPDNGSLVKTGSD